MLVLPRKKNESIVINNNITVTVVDIRDDKVRLGIVAPQEVPVHRQEVYDAIHDQGGVIAAPLTVASKPPQDDPWETFRDDDPLIAAGNERRSRFLGGIAWTIREKCAKPVTLGEVAQTLIDAIQDSGIDLSQARSLDHLKELLVQRIKRHDV
jgi:carbon storage regulator